MKYFGRTRWLVPRIIVLTQIWCLLIMRSLTEQWQQGSLLATCSLVWFSSGNYQPFPNAFWIILVLVIILQVCCLSLNFFWNGWGLDSSDLSKEIKSQSDPRWPLHFPSRWRKIGSWISSDSSHCHLNSSTMEHAWKCLGRTGGLLWNEILGLRLCVCVFLSLLCMILFEEGAKRRKTHASLRKQNKMEHPRGKWEIWHLLLEKFMSKDEEINKG